MILKKILKVFIPTTPNPTTGFFCLVPEDEVDYLGITVDEAFRLILSAGYASPQMERLAIRIINDAEHVIGIDEGLIGAVFFHQGYFFLYKHREV